MFDGDLLSERARLTPEKTALVSVETGERFSYADLNRRAEEAAGRIAAEGIGAGDRFGIHLPNSIEFLDLFFGGMKLGAISVPMSMRAAPTEIDAVIADSGAGVVFDESGVRHGGGSRSGAATMGGTAEDVACLLYTSGTTGKPKGVMIPRRQLLWNGYNTAINWDLRADDVSPIFTPLCHAGGLAVFLIPLFCTGGTIVLHKAFQPSEVWQSIERERCTVVLGVPTIWKMLMEAPEFATAALGHVRWFISGGAPLPTYIIDAYQRRGVPLKQGYGMTEVGVNCFTMTVAESRRKAGSIGKPMLFTEVRIVDAERRELPVGEIGEMEIRGPHVSLGYWRNEEATRESYRGDGWFRTGDLARRDEEGFFYIAGRRKEMFISGGLNVYPAEIEAALMAHPDVRDAAIVPIAHETWGESGVAFVVGDVTEESLREYLAQRIAKFKMPARYVFVDALPRTPYGKVLKEELKSRLAAGH